MTTVLEFEPLTITATAPAKPVLTYGQAAAPPVFKISNAVGLLGAGILWWAGWKKTSIALAGLHAIDIAGRQLSPAYAKETEFFYGYRR